MANQSSPHTPLRVVFCTCPSIYSDIVLQELIRSPDLELVGVVASTRILRKKGWGWWDVFLLVHRAGLRYATYLWLVTSLYFLFGRLLRNAQAGKYLSHDGVPIFKTRDINRADSVAFVKMCNPDAMLSAFFNQLIGPELLAVPPMGCLNIHPGLLPAYKGVDPVIHALARGEHQVGVTIHFQDQGFDTGPVVVADSIPVQSEDNLFSLNCKLFKLGSCLLRDTIAASGSIPEGAHQACSENNDTWPDSFLIAHLRKSGRTLLNPLSFLARCRGN